MSLDRQRHGPLALTQEQLSGLLGVRRESISVEALKLQRAGTIRYARGLVTVLDRPRLEQRSCGCFCPRQLGGAITAGVCPGVRPAARTMRPEKDCHRLLRNPPVCTVGPTCDQSTTACKPGGAVRVDGQRRCRPLILRKRRPAACVVAHRAQTGDLAHYGAGDRGMKHTSDLCGVELVSPILLHRLRSLWPKQMARRSSAPTARRRGLVKESLFFLGRST